MPWLYGIGGFFLFLGGVAYVLLKFSGSVRNLVGLEKDRLDIKKARREDEKAGSLIQPATFDDVREYDPKFKAIREARAEEELRELREPSEARNARFGCTLASMFFITVLMLVLALRYCSGPPGLGPRPASGQTRTNPGTEN